MAFWTLQTPGGPSTLCETCALQATNVGCAIGGFLKPATTMEEAGVLLELLFAVTGGELDLKSASFGACTGCGVASEEVA